MRKGFRAIYFHKFHARLERIVESEEKQKILLHGEQLGQLKMIDMH